MSLPRRLMSSRTQRLKAEPATNPLAFLMTPGFVATTGAAKPKIQLFHAGGREAEIEEVFRRILTAGVALDHVEIACASDAHRRWCGRALRHTWPVTLERASTFTRPGRALLGFCDWIETDFSAGHLRRLLQSGDMSVEEHEGFTAEEAAACSRAPRPGGGGPPTRWPSTA